MKCSFCGHEYEADNARASCHGCPMSGLCHMVKCPNCGYETPVGPEFKKMGAWWRRKSNSNLKDQRSETRITNLE